MANHLLVTAAPHYHSSENTRSIMIHVILALVPAIILSTVFFGLRVLFLLLVTVGSSILFETLFNLITRRKNTITDFSCIVTGFMLTCMLPVTTPYWMAVIGSLFAIVIVKMLFGGIGKNFMNPALSAKVLLLCWPSLINNYISPFEKYYPVFGEPLLFSPEDNAFKDLISSETALAYLKNGTRPPVRILDLLVGNTLGNIGEICSVLLLIGGVFLIFRKVITWHIPVSFIGTVALISFIFPKNGGFFDAEFMVYELLSGGLLLGAFFIATDYTTSPMTGRGKILYGLGCGLLTILLRYFSAYPEGVYFAILIMNIFAFSLDKIKRISRFGARGAQT